jgi:DNA-binding transcriptional LysR family regulator
MPGLEIIIATGNTSDILGRVLTGGLDLALVTLAGTPNRSLEARRLVVEPLVAYAPTSMLPATPTLRPAQLAALPLILYESGGATRGVVDTWFRRAGLAPRPIMELGSVEAIKVLAESGLGATILPRTALDVPAANMPAANMTVRPLRPAASRCLAVVLRRDKLRDRSLRVCLEELESLAATEKGAAVDRDVDQPGR